MTRLNVTLTYLIAFTVLISYCCAGFSEQVSVESQASKTQPSSSSLSTKGYHCLFMGHSFFAPIAKAFEEHPARCGFTDHRQTLVYHGGRGGAPKALWNDDSKEVAEAKAELKSGGVDLLGLTFYPQGSQLEDYCRWIDLALEHNPETKLVIHSPWPRYLNRTLEQYEMINALKANYISGLIKQLNKRYPNTQFLCIEQGRWMIGLWHAVEEGSLSEITAIKRTSSGARNECLFLDDLGHGSKIPVQLGALLWLATIYEVDLEQYDWDTNLEFDAKKLAKEICEN